MTLGQMVNTRSAIEAFFPHYMSWLCGISEDESKHLFGGVDNRVLIAMAHRISAIRIQDEQKRSEFEEQLTKLENAINSANKYIHTFWGFAEPDVAHGIKYHGKQNRYDRAVLKPKIIELRREYREFERAFSDFDGFMLSHFLKQ